MQYIPQLETAGFRVKTTPFFDDQYLESLYGDSGKKVTVSKYFFERLRSSRDLQGTDLIWLEKEMLPWAPWFIEQLALPSGIPIVSDYDDAVFHRYDRHRRAVVRKLLGPKIGRVMAASQLVMAGNPYLATHARNAGAARVEVVPTVVDLAAYTVAPATDDGPRVGWIGTPQTWQELARPIHGTLSPVLDRMVARFRAVGASLHAETHGNLEVIPWSEASEVALIQGMDIGVMPLPDTPWARGKCGYKLIQYMACGLPVVASPVGVNKDIVEHGVNGFLAETDAQWREAIETLLSNADLRRRMGAAGRKKVEKSYSLQVWGPRVAQMLRQVADEGRKA